MESTGTEDAERFEVLWISSLYSTEHGVVSTQRQGNLRDETLRELTIS